MVGIGTEGTAALEQLVRDDHARLVRAVTLAAGDVALAEDAVQEALARAWERLEGGGSIEHLGGWVVTVALNLTRSGRRRSRRLVPLDPAHVATSRSPRAAESVDLARAVRSLPDRQRQVVVLHYYLDQDLRTVAAIVGRSEGAVKNALFHARAALARALDDTREVPR